MSAYALQSAGAKPIAERDNGTDVVFEWPGGGLFLVRDHGDGSETRVVLSKWHFQDLFLEEPGWRVVS